MPRNVSRATSNSQRSLPRSPCCSRARRRAKGRHWRAIAIDPKAPEGWYALGNHLAYLTPQRAEAAAAYRKAIELDPSWPQAWSRLGRVLAKDDRPREAEPALRHAIELAPNDTAARMNLALLLLNDLRVTEANMLLLDLPGEDPQVRAAKGRTALLHGDLDVALDHYLAASAAEPLLAQTQIGSAVAYYERGEVARANQAVAGADRIDANDPLPPLMASVIANDHFLADTAIEQAREALRRIRLQENGDLTGIAASRDGAINVGQAFQRLGLDDWGNNLFD